MTPQRHGFPWAKGLALACITLSESMCSTVLYPFVPFMVQDFGVSPDDVGFYAGLLASAYNIAQIPASIFWGKLSDVFGRRRILFFGLLGQATGMLLLGLSWSVPTAIGARCVGGLLQGNMGVARALLKETVRADQQAFAFSLFGAAWGVGFFLGPLIGGELSQIAERIPQLRGTLFDDFPYFLPCVITSVNSVVWISCLPRLKQQKVYGDGQQQQQQQQQPGRTSSTLSAVQTPPEESKANGHGEEGSSIGSIKSAAAADADELRTVEIELEEQRQMSSGGGLGTASSDASPGRGGWTCTQRQRQCCCCHGSRSNRVISLISSDVMRSIYAQTGLHFTVLGMAELYPLFAADQVRGLGMRPHDVGDTLLPLGLSLLLSPCIFPPLNKRVGPLVCFRGGMILFSVINFCFPLLRVARATSPSALLFCAGWINFMRGIGGPMAFGSVSMNGIASSFASLARAVSPWLSGTIYASSSTNAFPFDSAHAPFYMLCIVGMLTVLLTGCGMSSGAPLSDR
jgi:predicted MFS family arabinose efflux permease